MTRYKQAEFEEDDNSSVGSVQLTGTTTTNATHIRYHTVTTIFFFNILGKIVGNKYITASIDEVALRFSPRISRGNAGLKCNKIEIGYQKYNKLEVSSTLVS